MSNGAFYIVAVSGGTCVESSSKGIFDKTADDTSTTQRWTAEYGENSETQIAFRNADDGKYLRATSGSAYGKMTNADERQWWTLEKGPAPGSCWIKCNDFADAYLCNANGHYGNNNPVYIWPKQLNWTHALTWYLRDANAAGFTPKQWDITAQKSSTNGVDDHEAKEKALAEKEEKLQALEQELAARQEEQKAKAEQLAEQEEDLATKRDSAEDKSNEEKDNAAHSQLEEAQALQQETAAKEIALKQKEEELGEKENELKAQEEAMKKKSTKEDADGCTKAQDLQNVRQKVKDLEQRLAEAQKAAKKTSSTPAPPAKATANISKPIAPPSKSTASKASPKVYPPPRKIKRKVVGYVYASK